jgi:polyribonucleotide nucleotidyltransferase
MAASSHAAIVISNCEEIVFNLIKKSTPTAVTLTLETGEIARQANGAVLVSLGDTVVLVTAVAAKSRSLAGFFR